MARQMAAFPSAVAVAWTLRQPGVTAAIAGARSPEQLDEWVTAATLELSESDLQHLARKESHDVD